jgi:hypothetical protein
MSRAARFHGFGHERDHYAQERSRTCAGFTGWAVVAFIADAEISASGMTYAIQPVS